MSDFTQSMDAREWAKAFCDFYPGNDEGIMIGWFANAIMRGYDEGARSPRAVGRCPICKCEVDDKAMGHHSADCIDIRAHLAQPEIYRSLLSESRSPRAEGWKPTEGDWCAVRWKGPLSRSVWGTMVWDSEATVEMFEDVLPLPEPPKEAGE